MFLKHSIFRLTKAHCILQSIGLSGIIAQPCRVKTYRRLSDLQIQRHISSQPFATSGEGKMSVDLRQYTLPNDTGICFLECGTAFNALTEKEKLYAHYLSQGSWYGSLICLYQCSAESPGIFILLQRLFREKDSVAQLQQIAQQCGFSDDEFKDFIIYAAGFYSNMGNYKSFGDTKIIPKVSKEKVSKLIEASPAYQADPVGMGKLWTRVQDRMYSLATREQQMGLGEQGISTYFSDNCTTRDAEIAQEFMQAKNLSAYNNRLFKTVKDGGTEYEIRIASAETSGERGSSTVTEAGLLGSHVFTPAGADSPVTFHVTRGDYAPLMQLLSDNLAKAREHAANENESSMLAEYVRSFGQGSIEAHKDGSRHWIRNQGPIIETYIGFIESYRDPFGVRGEFEGFVACVNKEMSAKFAELVAKAEHFLPLLPWPSSYEKDKFLRPDFTSLDVLMFGSSGIPAGINIPNYDDIRQSEGFKNVSLGNVLSAGYKDTKVTFLGKDDADLYTQLKAPSFEVQVGLHELLGHGSGKMFYRNADGTFNFDQDSLKHTETGKPISSWYEAGETYDSKFQAMGSSYEECRAECVGIYLCLSSEVLRIFGHENSQADDIIYINWLNMARAGLLALEFYTPESCKWRQAHMQARYVILRVLLEAGEGLVTISKVTNPEDGEPDLIMSMDRSKIATTGKKAIDTFLRKLQVYKATGDYAAAKAMYDHYSEVNDRDDPHFLSLRATVIDRKQPRKMFVQSNTTVNGDKVALHAYEASPEGLITSFRERFPSDIETSLQELWDRDACHFPPTSAKK